MHTQAHIQRLQYDVIVCWSSDVIPVRTLGLAKHYRSMFLEQAGVCVSVGGCVCQP